MAWTHNLGEEFETRTVMHAALVLAPLVAVATASGQPIWLEAAIVSGSAFIVMEKTNLAPLGVALHGVAIAVGFLVLLAAISTPPAFVGATAAMAGASILVTAKGDKLRSLGNFTFIPALYLACKAAEGTPRAALLERGLSFLPYIAAALLPVIALAAAEHVRDRDLGVSHIRHLTRFRRRVVDHGVAASFAEAMVAVTFAVACASIFVEWRHVEHGQWVIWSAASVVTGDAASARRKLGDRLLGAFVGVPIGVSLGFLMPHNGIVIELATVGTVLSLVAFRRYPLAFGLRCALVALAIIDADQSIAFAVERVENVVLGGVIGLAFVFGIHGLTLVGQLRASRGQPPE
ncbi:FUSC family protein [Bradyrhizobium sp. AZCC 2289]|uniref:FUSC family protein n=1 Tax=Bradyrhizobium sp. AZCC 2289 TaxID=3117026 RepID=UPI002FEEB537